MAYTDFDNKKDGVVSDWQDNVDDGLVAEDADDAKYVTNVDPASVGKNNPRPNGGSKTAFVLGTVPD